MPDDQRMQPEVNPRQPLGKPLRAQRQIDACKCMHHASCASHASSLQDCMPPSSWSPPRSPKTLAFLSSASSSRRAWLRPKTLSEELWRRPLAWRKAPVAMARRCYALAVSHKGLDCFQVALSQLTEFFYRFRLGLRRSRYAGDTTPLSPAHSTSRMCMHTHQLFMKAQISHTRAYDPGNRRVCGCG